MVNLKSPRTLPGRARKNAQTRVVGLRSLSAIRFFGSEKRILEESSSLKFARTGLPVAKCSPPVFCQNSPHQSSKTTSLQNSCSSRPKTQSRFSAWYFFRFVLIYFMVHLRSTKRKIFRGVASHKEGLCCVAIALVLGDICDNFLRSGSVVVRHRVQQLLFFVWVVQI